VPTATWAGIGIDVEAAGALEVDDAVGVLDLDERSAATSAEDATLRWSAKESAFKAWSMVSGGLDRVDPRDLHADPAIDGELTVTATGALRGRVRPIVLHGRWDRCDDAVLTALVVPPVTLPAASSDLHPSISSTMPST